MQQTNDALKVMVDALGLYFLEEVEEAPATTVSCVQHSMD